MRHLARLGFVLGPLFALACAAPHADSTHAPETSRSAADSSAPTEGTAGASNPTAADPDPGPTTEPLARRPPPPPPPRPVNRRPAPSPYPYRVEVLGDSGGRLATFHQAGRTYVLGSLGERYTVHVTNPTARRVEAVISVDGLDAMGTPADFAHKSGYVIAPYGDLTVNGFRTSMQEVATFRFSSVRDSYASREGHARNVGVIGVAFFPERPLPPPPPPQAEIAPRPSPAPSKHATSGYDDNVQGFKSAPMDEDVATASPAAGAAAGAGGGAPATAAPAAPAPRRERSGLGTEFGEQRTSVVQYVEFQRADATHPSAMAEIRYNDRNGLLALGNPLAPPRPSELDLRETANPFPLSQFASPPPPVTY